MRPPVPLRLRPLLEPANFVTVGLLPQPIRRQYGFGWDPLRGLALRGHTEYARARARAPAAARLRYADRRICGHRAASPRQRSTVP